MQAFLNQFLTIQAADADLRRRGRTVAILALVMVGLALLSFPMALARPDSSQGGVIAITGAILVMLAAFVLARSGRITLSASLVIATSSLAILGSMLSHPGERVVTTPFYLSIAMVIAGVVLRPYQIWIVFLLNMLGIGLVTARLPADLMATSEARLAIAGAFLLLFMTTAISFVGARVAHDVLRTSVDARAEAEAMRQELAVANSELEQRVVERTAELSRALEAQQQLTDELSASLTAQRDLSQTIVELTLPIIPLREDTLIVPLIGSIDSARAAQLLNNLLTQIEGRPIRTVIIDVTGVPVVDTQVAQSLLRTADATRLMGARTMLVGIRPEVAQALVGLGVDLAELHTAATLQDVLHMPLRGS